MANPHKGHRERLKLRFLESGLDSFTDVQALELLLFYAIPQKDTNPIAHALLERFGSLSQVLDAPVEELKKVQGISDHAATLLFTMASAQEASGASSGRNTQFGRIPVSFVIASEKTQGKKIEL